MPITGSFVELNAPGVPVLGDPAAGVVSDAGAAESLRRVLADGRNCWAETVEAAKAAPRIAVVNAGDVRRTPRLLA
jgi:hypothetical protein